MFEPLLYTLRAQGVQVGMGEWLTFLRGLQLGLASDVEALYQHRHLRRREQALAWQPGSDLFSEQARRTWGVSRTYLATAGFGAGALGGAGCSSDPDSMGGRNGVFIMALDIAAFTGPERFHQEVDSFIDFLKSSRLLPGFDQIALPGEIEHRMRRQKEAEGLVIDEETYRQIHEAATSVEVKIDLEL